MTFEFVSLTYFTPRYRVQKKKNYCRGFYQPAVVAAVWKKSN
jgi:hypothetical protein